MGRAQRRDGDQQKRIHVSEPVAIIGGTGDVGYGLALRWSRAGVPVIIGSRDPGRAREAAERTGAQEGRDNADAARRAAVVVVAVPFVSQAQTVVSLQGALRQGQILVDCTVPLAAVVGGRATQTLGVWQGSAAQQAAQLVPDGVRVVAALHTVGAPKLADLTSPLDEDVLICGDRKAEKRQVADLISRIEGLRAVDAGRLEHARIVESITALLIGVNGRYKTHAGIRVTNLPEALWTQ
jgi:NADPH-dependent F420 reductase